MIKKIAIVGLITLSSLFAKNCSNIVVGDNWQVGINGAEQKIFIDYVNTVGAKIYVTGRLGNSGSISGYIMDTMFDYPTVILNWSDVSTGNTGQMKGPMGDSSCMLFSGTNTIYKTGDNINSSFKAVKNVATVNSNTNNTNVNTNVNSSNLTPPAIPTSSSCNTDAFNKVTNAGRWYMLGAMTNGCSITGLKALGALAVYPFDSNTNNYSTTDSIEAGYGFWIKK